MSRDIIFLLTCVTFLIHGCMYEYAALIALESLRQRDSTLASHSY